MHSINKCTERPLYSRNNRHSWRSRVKIAQQTDCYKEAAHNRKLDPHSFLLGRCCTRKKCVGDERKSAHFKSIARVFPFPPTGSTGDSLYYETSPSAWRHSIRTSHFVVFVRKTKPVNRHQRVVEVKRYPSSHGWWAREGRRFTFFFYRRINTITSHHAKLRAPNHNNNTRALFNVYPNCCPVALKIQPLRSNESRDHFSYIIIFVFFYDLDFFFLSFGLRSPLLCKLGRVWSRRRFNANQNNCGFRRPSEKALGRDCVVLCYFAIYFQSFCLTLYSNVM